jgi:hypothetical protein
MHNIGCIRFRTLKTFLHRGLLQYSLYIASIPRHALTHSSTSSYVLVCPHVLAVLARPNTSWHVLARPNTSWHVLTRPNTSWHITVVQGARGHER